MRKSQPLPSSRSDRRSAGQAALRSQRPDRSAAARSAAAPTSVGRRGGGSHRQDNPVPMRKGWGSVARKGAAVATTGRGGGDRPAGPDGPNAARYASSADNNPGRTRPPPRPSEAKEQEVWVLTRKRRKGKAAAGSASRQAGGSASDWRLADDAIAELSSQLPEHRVARFAGKLRDAANAYIAERYQESQRLVRVVLKEAPATPSARELNGLIFYRLGQWELALRELESAHAVTRSFDLHPVMADACRALKRPEAAERLWEDLKNVSPSPEVMAEGRIVMAHVLVDRGELSGAIGLLEKAPKPRRTAGIRHLRTSYALADLYERSGDVGRARMLFARIVQIDPSVADVVDRLEALN